MGAGRDRYYNPWSGKWVKPKRWYEKNKRRNSNGCYIATAVYGSYDCPEVWVLRRYRDYCLANNYWGRLFIKIYYMVSPKVIKLFGNKYWFNEFFRKKLDVFVCYLRRQGFSSEEYSDIEFK